MFLIACVCYWAAIWAFFLPVWLRGFNDFLYSVLFLCSLSKCCCCFCICNSVRKCVGLLGILLETTELDRGSPTELFKISYFLPWPSTERQCSCLSYKLYCVFERTYVAYVWNLHRVCVFYFIFTWYFYYRTPDVNFAWISLVGSYFFI